MREVVVVRLCSSRQLVTVGVVRYSVRAQGVTANVAARTRLAGSERGPTGLLTYPNVPKVPTKRECRRLASGDFWPALMCSGIGIALMHK